MNVKSEKVLIVMATYNGERYLEEQLESIHKQTHLNWELRIRDDNSSDNTLLIIEKWIKKDKRIKIIRDSLGNLGHCQNFGKLIGNNLDEKYIMFCDQDDIWIENKIELTLKEMKKAEHEFGEGVPILIHSDLTLVDQKQKLISSSFREYTKINPFEEQPLNKLIASNFVYGCTVMINSSLIKICYPIPREVEVHDSWLALIAASLGKIVYISQPTILYRQHSSNVTGLRFNLKSRINRNLTKRGWEYTNEKIDRRIMQIYRLKERFSNDINDKNKVILSQFLLAAKRGGLKSIYIYTKHGICRQGVLRTVPFYLSLLRKNKKINY